MDTQKTVITIGREYGSGGHHVGQALARMLGIPYYDKEILTRAAKESGICEELFEHHDERASPSYLFSMSPGISGVNSVAGLSQTLPLNHRIFRAQFETILKLAGEGACVVVGRCADYVLKDWPYLARVFIYAEQDVRVEHVMASESLSRERAKDRVRRMDKQRQSYYNFFADGNWGHRGNYDLLLRMDHIGVEEAAQTIKAFVESRA